MSRTAVQLKERGAPTAVQPGRIPANLAIAGKLADYAALLDRQGADGFRAKAYRRAADVVSALETPVADILATKGRDGLVALPAIGRGIAGAIAEMIVTGRWSQLERLRGSLVPEALLKTLPGIGPKLARRLADDRGIESLEDLEAALEQGSLQVRGIGRRRQAMLAAVLSQRLGRILLGPVCSQFPVPPVSLLLQVDRIYREKAEKGELRKIAPKRFNPRNEAWLPILHARHDNWHFTVLYSNTALAHRLGKTGDWVIIYFQTDGQPEMSSTVVTETRGPLAGRRVVRGRENETSQEARNP